MADVASVLVMLGVSQEQAVQVWQPLVVFVTGIVLYSIFIFEFYRFIARRDIFQLRLKQYATGLEHLGNAVRFLLYWAEYILLFPVLTVLWFLAFTAFLAFLAAGHGVETVLLVSMAVVTSIRITAYYDEDLSRDLAKMLPFAILGIVVVEGAGAFSYSEAVGLLLAVPAHWQTVLYYLAVLIPLELLLRFVVLVVPGGDDDGSDA